MGEIGTETSNRRSRESELVSEHRFVTSGGRTWKLRARDTGVAHNSDDVRTVELASVVALSIKAACKFCKTDFGRYQSFSIELSSDRTDSPQQLLASVERQHRLQQDIRTVDDISRLRVLLGRMADAPDRRHEDHPGRCNPRDVLRVVPCPAW
jgi:hypothetical protein